MQAQQKLILRAHPQSKSLPKFAAGVYSGDQGIDTNENTKKCKWHPRIRDRAVRVGKFPAVPVVGDKSPRGPPVRRAIRDAVRLDHTGMARAGGHRTLRHLLPHRCGRVCRNGQSQSQPSRRRPSGAPSCRGRARRLAWSPARCGAMRAPALWHRPAAGLDRVASALVPPAAPPPPPPPQQHGLGRHRRRPRRRRRALPRPPLGQSAPRWAGARSGLKGGP